jgi:hypothetical protein
MSGFEHRKVIEVSVSSWIRMGITIHSEVNCHNVESAVITGLDSMDRSMMIMWLQASSPPNFGSMIAE